MKLSKMLKVVVALCVVGWAVGGPPLIRSREEIQKFKDFLESTRTSDGVVLEERMARYPNASVWESSGKYQGDILLDEWQVEALVQQYSSGRNAYIWPNTRWPFNTVVYEFAAGVFNAAQRDFILQTMREIERNTCIRFRERRSREFNYVRITGNADGCYAHVGFWAGRGIHILNLARANPGTGCLHRIVIIHEFLHSIGFFHMQSTYNRYDFVRIHWENIQRDMAYNFDRYGPELVSNLGFPYEYTSCMHYGPYAFSINGRPSMTATRAHSGTMGQMEFVTTFDWLRVSRHYGCI